MPDGEAVARVKRAIEEKSRELMRVVEEAMTVAREAATADRWAAFSDVELGDIAAGLQAKRAGAGEGEGEGWPLLREVIAELERRRPA